MRVLVVDPNSSRLRFKLLRIDPLERRAAPECLASGSVASIGPGALARAGLGLEPLESQQVRACDHGEAAA